VIGTLNLQDIFLSCVQIYEKSENNQIAHLVGSTNLRLKTLQQKNSSNHIDVRSSFKKLDITNTNVKNKS
jgi:hypothetical protein